MTTFRSMMNSLRAPVLALLAGLPMLAAAASSMLPFESPGTTWAEHPELAGAVVDRRVDGYSFNEAGGHAIKGEVESLVVRESGSGMLDFYWRVTSAPDSFWGIASLFGMGGAGTERYTVGWLSAGFGAIGGVRPAAWVNDEFLFGFDGGNNVNPGMQSNFLFMHTDATSYALNGRLALQRDMQRITPSSEPISPYVATYAPVPEPELYAMMAVGLGYALVAARRRRQAALR